jgi:hypothetical protein
VTDQRPGQNARTRGIWSRICICFARPRFFDQLGPERCAALTHVLADQADWIAEVVAEGCPTAVQCAGPFHVV